MAYHYFGLLTHESELIDLPTGCNDIVGYFRHKFILRNVAQMTGGSRIALLGSTDP